MKASHSNHNPPDPGWDDDDALWRLLGESPRPEPDAWFTVRTLARCRHAGFGGVESWRISFSGMWRWVLGSGLGVGLAVVLFTSQIHTDTAVPEKQKNVQEAFEIMASLNSSDSDSSSTSSWQDSSL